MNNPKLTPEHEAAVEEAEADAQEQQPAYQNSDMPILLEEQPLNFDQEPR